MSDYVGIAFASRLDERSATTARRGGNCCRAFGHSGTTRTEQQQRSVCCCACSLLTLLGCYCVQVAPAPAVAQQQAVMPPPAAAPATQGTDGQVTASQLQLTQLVGSAGDQQVLLNQPKAHIIARARMPRGDRLVSKLSSWE